MNTPRVAERELVGPYQVLKAIGAGGTSRIDLARLDRSYGFQRHVVIKRPLEHLRADPDVAASLRREAALGGRLRHPNLVSVLDAGVHDGYDYLALEYVHGVSLRAAMQAPAGAVRALPIGAALSIVIEAARGLHDAHELTTADGTPLGLVHRDVSPGNLLIGVDGTVKLADFGIAKDTRITTLSGSMRGTVTYMAPEQCRGHAFDRRADVFSLGVILFELVTHRRLFWADNDVAALHKVLSGDVPDPRSLVPGLAPELVAMLRAAVAHDPAGRIGSARELADRLEQFAARSGIGTGARWIARSLGDSLGPAAAPWIRIAPKTATIPQAEASLISVISSIPIAAEEPVLPTFGPADASDPLEDLATPVGRPRTETRDRRRPHRGVLAAVLGLGAAVGISITVFAMTRSEEPDAPAPRATPAPAAAAAATPPVPVTPSTLPRAAAATVTAPVVAPEQVSPVAAPTRRPDPAKPASGVHVPPAKPTVAAGAAKPAPKVEAAPQDAVDAGVAGPPRVEWTPDMLLPSDPKPGANR